MSYYSRLLKAVAFSTLFFVLFIGVAVAVGAFFGGDAIPPVRVLYLTAGANFLLDLRVASNSLVAVALMLMGSLLISTADLRSSFASKVRSWAVGLAMVSTAAWDVALIGMLLYGGVWHWAVTVTGVLAAIAMVTAAIIVFTTPRLKLVEEDETSA